MTVMPIALIENTRVAIVVKFALPLPTHAPVAASDNFDLVSYVSRQVVQFVFTEQ